MPREQNTNKNFVAFLEQEQNENKKYLELREREQNKNEKNMRVLSSLGTSPNIDPALSLTKFTKIKIFGPIGLYMDHKLLS